jgi:hypothetical protein
VSIAALVCILCAGGSSAVQAKANCVRPDLERFLEASRAIIAFSGSHFPFPEADFLTIEEEGGVLQWVGVRWSGPEDGALFVLDCSGGRLGALRLGAVLALHPGPVLPEVGKTIAVRYTASIGTGSRLENVELVGFVDAGILRLWKHTAYEHAFVLPSEDGVEEKYEWTFGSRGTALRVVGKRVIYPKPKDPGSEWGPGTSHDLGTTTYCWSASGREYRRC